MDKEKEKIAKKNTSWTFCGNCCHQYQLREGQDNPCFCSILKEWVPYCYICSQWKY
jgi:hypothetical protein